MPTPAVTSPLSGGQLFPTKIILQGPAAVCLSPGFPTWGSDFHRALLGAGAVRKMGLLFTCVPCGPALPRLCHREDSIKALRSPAVRGPDSAFDPMSAGLI